MIVNMYINNNAGIGWKVVKFQGKLAGTSGGIYSTNWEKWGNLSLPVAVLDVCGSKLDAYNWGLVVYIYMEYAGNNHMNYLNYIHLYMGYPQWSHGLCILAYEQLINWHAAQEGALLDQGNQNIKSYSQRPKTHGDFALQLAMMDAGFLAFRGQLTHPYKD